MVDFDTIDAKLKEVMGYDERERFIWWTSPHMALNQQNPFNILAQGEGEKLMNLLGQIEHGVYI